MPNRDSSPPDPLPAGKRAERARKKSAVGTSPTLLVTGANGFLGSRLCARALERGMRVVAMTRAKSDLSLLEPLLHDHPEAIERRAWGRWSIRRATPRSSPVATSL
jgi:hypothetical protein